MSKHFKKYS